jgi:hypothetical protein
MSPVAVTAPSATTTGARSAGTSAVAALARFGPISTRAAVAVCSAGSVAAFSTLAT